MRDDLDWVHLASALCSALCSVMSLSTRATSEAIAAMPADSTGHQSLSAAAQDAGAQVRAE